MGAVVLALAGGLFYWLAYAGSGLTIHPSELLRFSSDGSHDASPITVTPDAAPSLPEVPDQPAQAAGWTAPPRVANIKPVAAEAAPASPHAAEAPAPGPSLASPIEAPEPLPPVLDDLPTTAMRARVVTPTPQAACPTTPYPGYANGVGPGAAAGATPTAVIADQSIRDAPATSPSR